MLDVRAIKILEVEIPISRAFCAREMGQPWFTVRIDKYAMG
jgi:hypothetical protein